ncbi:hypothetical protein E3T43_00950 [Cryobacterium sp. Hh7]|uniref:hypothetical protein n=1 Tax=Cryobacterium sp. Hh7 TaxID=1259159 RepID=UPI00106C9E48|nr:hypothetical protein [Cryobacterium sp. Hh7]TFD61194.1 hypothetical protein E3T43_00950 [Cryobacterium sp. Hh7]
MADSTELPVLPVQPGDYIHFLESGYTVQTFPGAGFVAEVGDEVVVTAEMIAGSWDSENHSWLELAGDESAQLARFGKVHFAIGRVPADVTARADFPRKRK